MGNGHLMRYLAQVGADCRVDDGARLEKINANNVNFVAIKLSEPVISCPSPVAVFPAMMVFLACSSPLIASMPPPLAAELFDSVQLFRIELAELLP